MNTIVTYIKTKTKENNSEFIGMMLGMIIDEFSNDDCRNILENIIILSESTLKEEIYFIGSYEETEILVNATKQVANVFSDLFEILELEINTDKILSYDEYVKEGFHNIIESNKELKEYIKENISKDTILDKLLNGMELNLFDKEILAL